MKCRLLGLACMALAVCVSSPVSAEQPPANFGQTSFLDGEAEPGFLFQQIFEHYNANSFLDAQGQREPGNQRLEVSVSVTHFAYISHTQWLGAYVGFEVLVPTLLDAHTNFLPGSAVNTGIGDPMISPILLQWNDTQLFGHPYSQRLSFIMHFPWGNYDRYAAINPDAHIFSLNPYYAFTLVLNPQWEFSGRLMYTKPGKNDEPNPVVAQHYTQFGQSFNANLSLSRKLTENWRVGVAGYAMRQISLDQRDGVNIPNSRMSTNGIGPTVMHDWKNNRFFLSVFKEFDGKGTTEGNRINFRYMHFF
jgi:hypothetical protein